MKKVVLMTVFTVSCMLCSCGNNATHNNEEADSVKVENTDSMSVSVNDSVSVDTIIADSVE